MAGSCEHGNEPSGSIKCGRFIDKLSYNKFLKKDPGTVLSFFVSWTATLEIYE
jgi:hypothetical protein